MSAATDKVKGLANEAIGNVKQAAGRAFNKPGLTGEGIARAKPSRPSARSRMR